MKINFENQTVYWKGKLYTFAEILVFDLSRSTLHMLSKKLCQ